MLVYCFKSGSPSAAGLPYLNNQTAMLDPSLEINPFEITDSDRGKHRYEGNDEDD